MKANSIAARIAIEAPKLAITIEIDCALAAQSREQQPIERQREPRRQRHRERRGEISAGLIENSPIPSPEPTTSAETPAAIASAA